MTDLLCIDDLQTFIFDRDPPVKAVHGASLKILSGELFALVGESGCGKTMLALSIARLLPPQARIIGGSIHFQGRDLTRLSDEQIRRLRGGRIAYLFQDPMTSLNPVMTVEEQLLEAIHLHRSLAGKPARDLGCELLSRVQIPLPSRRLRQYPHQLSGGMCQRVMLAMALAGNPALLIADEPTTALDVTTQAEILELLKDLCHRFGIGILLITHHLSAVGIHADRIGVMYAGHIVEISGREEFYRSPSHPYAQALLACIPKIAAGKQAFRSIPGSVPDLRFTPAGCPFHPRCPEVIERCRGEEPQLKPVGSSRSAEAPGLASFSRNHWVSCWQRERAETE